MIKDHVYGPVPSRRLGRSLGVDLVPLKTCSYDCASCQVGTRNGTRDIVRERYGGSCNGPLRLTVAFLLDCPARTDAFLHRVRDIREIKPSQVCSHERLRASCAMPAPGMAFASSLSDGDDPGSVVRPSQPRVRRSRASSLAKASPVCPTCQGVEP